MKQKASEVQSHGESSSMWLFSGESEGGEGIHNVSPLLRGASGGGALEGFDFLLDSVGASASSASDLGGSTSASARASAGASVSTGAGINTGVNTSATLVPKWGKHYAWERKCWHYVKC